MPSNIQQIFHQNTFIEPFENSCIKLSCLVSYSSSQGTAVVQPRWDIHRQGEQLEMSIYIKCEALHEAQK